MRLTKISLYERMKGLQPELDRLEVDVDIKEIFRGDPVKDLRKQLQVPESRPGSFLAVVETSGSKF